MKRVAALLLLCACGGTPAPVPVVVTPSTATVAAGGTAQFSANVAVSWAVDESGAGTVTQAGLYTAPAEAATAHVRATSFADPGQSAAAVVTVTAPVAPSLPAIFSFGANPALIAAGASSTLSWSVTGGDSISIDHGVGTVSGQSVQVSPASTTTWTLTAHNAAGDSTATATVKVKPAIASFSASPNTIAAGASASLSWSASANTATLTLDPGGLDVTGTAGTTVSPASTTTYTLTAANAEGSATATAAVAVSPPAGPVIHSFAASPAAVALGDPTPGATLSWNVTGATSVSIDNSIGAVGAIGSQPVSPAATTAYTLTATDGSGHTSTAAATFSIVSISSFTATPSPVASGGAVTLAWTASGAASFSIDNGVGAVTGSSTVVLPAASATYHLTAANGPASFAAAATVTVAPASPSALISSFAADKPFIPQGGSATLNWVTNAGGVSLDHAIGARSGRSGSVSVSPSATTTYTLTAGGSTAMATVTVGPASTFLAPGNPGGSPAVTLTLDSSQAVQPISPFVYGYNGSAAGQALMRSGGNRLTAYNWETNASNAGSDFGYESDSFLSPSSVPAAAIDALIDSDQADGIASLVTLPMQGWVAADESGTVSGFPSAPRPLRFLQTPPRKGEAFASSPDVNDTFVYQDEFVNHLITRYGTAPISYELDNEPELWSSTHPEIQYGAITYAALIRSSIDLSAAVKDAAPQSLVYGPVSYGFNGYTTLQSSTDAPANATAWPPSSATWFLESYLQAMRAASESQGRRLVDVLDIHWYPEATANGVRIIEADNTAPVQAARVQAPRSLWDAGYTCVSNYATCNCWGGTNDCVSSGTSPASCETSWIANYFDDWCTTSANPNPYGPIQLLSWLKTKIAGSWPGTRIGITEYDYGGADDISGAVAEADALGIFGAQGVYAAAFWPLLADNSFVRGALRSFRDYDGAGHNFGDTSFSAVSSDNSKASIYASFDAATFNTASDRVVLVAVNKTTGSLLAQVQLKHPRVLNTAHVWQLTASSAVPASLAVPGFTPAGNAFNLTLPAYSVTTIVLTP